MSCTKWGEWREQAGGTNPEARSCRAGPRHVLTWSRTGVCRLLQSPGLSSQDCVQMQLQLGKTLTAGESCS